MPCRHLHTTPKANKDVRANFDLIRKEWPYPLLSPDNWSFKRVGATADRWYTVPYTGDLVAAAVTPTANELLAIPLLISRTVKIDRIGINVRVGGGAGTKGRVGIYYDDGNLYPGKLLFDTGVAAEYDLNAAAVQTSVVDINLKLGVLWWVWHGSDNPQMWGLNHNSIHPQLGWANTLSGAGGKGWKKAAAYAALPTTFPAGATVVTNDDIPAIFFRPAVWL